MPQMQLAMGRTYHLRTAMNASCAELSNQSSQTSNSSSAAPMQWSTVLYIAAVCVPTTVIMFFTIVGNILVLLARAHVGQRITRLFVVNLAIADLLVGSIVLPLSVTNLVLQSWPLGRTMCRLWVFSDIVFCTASIVTICMISIDRYMAVARPLKYRVLITQRKCVAAVASVWAISLTVLLATVRWDSPTCVDETFCFVGNELQHLTHSVVFAFFLPAFVTLTLYWKIYVISRSRQRAIDSGFLVVFGKNMNFLTSSVRQENEAMRIHRGASDPTCDIVQHQRSVLQSHQRLALTLGLVSCAFLFCWLPFFSLYLINSRCECVPGLALDALTWIGYCNSAINPIIYAFTIKDFKHNVQLMLRPWMLCAGAKPAVNKQYNIQTALSPGQMAKLLAGHAEAIEALHAIEQRQKKKRVTNDINNWDSHHSAGSGKKKSAGKKQPQSSSPSTNASANSLNNNNTTASNNSHSQLVKVNTQRNSVIRRPAKTAVSATVVSANALDSASLSSVHSNGQAAGSRRGSLKLYYTSHETCL